jgi:hypothetical protein
LKKKSNAASINATEVGILVPNLPKSDKAGKEMDVGLAGW